MIVGFWLQVFFITSRQRQTRYEQRKKDGNPQKNTFVFPEYARIFETRHTTLFTIYKGMALKTLVKVGSITNLSDARYCAGMGVDFLGFQVIDGQPGSIPVRSFQEIRGWITGPQIVAEVYGIETAGQLNNILDEVHPDYLELGLEEFRKIGGAIVLPYILRLSSEDELPADLADKPAYLFIDHKFDAVVSKYIPDYELLVQINAVAEVGNVLGQTGVSGIALNGGPEIRPGLKDYEALSGILEALEED
jgi:phosphoribosylanthranilate isomerase